MVTRNGDDFTLYAGNNVYEGGNNGGGGNNKMMEGLLSGLGSMMTAQTDGASRQRRRVCEEGLRVVKHFCQERNGGVS